MYRGRQASVRPRAPRGRQPRSARRDQQAVIFHSDNLELSEQFRRHHRTREERQQPVLELRLIPVRSPRQERHLSTLAAAEVLGRTTVQVRGA
jgi:hypothetical protein